MFDSQRRSCPAKAKRCRKPVDLLERTPGCEAVSRPPHTRVTPHARFTLSDGGAGQGTSPQPSFRPVDWSADQPTIKQRPTTKASPFFCEPCEAATILPAAGHVNRRVSQQWTVPRDAALTKCRRIPDAGPQSGRSRVGRGRGPTASVGLAADRCRHRESFLGRRRPN